MCLVVVDVENDSSVKTDLSILSSSGPGPGHCPRLFSKTGLNSCLKRTRAEAIITETPTTHPPPPQTFQRLVPVPGHCHRLLSMTGLNCEALGPGLVFV